jgi:amino acid transporter
MAETVIADIVTIIVLVLALVFPVALLLVLLNLSQLGDGIVYVISILLALIIFYTVKKVAPSFPLLRSAAQTFIYVTFVSSFIYNNQTSVSTFGIGYILGALIGGFISVGILTAIYDAIFHRKPKETTQQQVQRNKNLRRQNK